MKIVESKINLSSEHEAVRRLDVETRYTQRFSQVLEAQDRVHESRERLVKMLEQLIESILAAMDGKKCRGGAADACLPTREPPGNGRPTRAVEWSWEQTRRETEHERTTVEGAGKVVTADGRCIDFNLCLNMERSYSSEVNQSESGNMVLRDPLVIHFGGDAAQLAKERIDFDLDGDGALEKIPGLKGASGYLVFDRNHNGRVDDGTELFGTRSEDGFSDLVGLDQDKNGWIDEGDAAFADLYVWDGRRADAPLESIGAHNVGALWTGSVDSPFSIKDEANLLLGEIRATGLWLSEEGKVGVLQQVDLALATADEPHRERVENA